MVNAYNISSQTLQQVPRLRSIRVCHISCVQGNILCVAGGYDPRQLDGEELNYVELLDVAKLEAFWRSENSQCNWQSLEIPQFTTLYDVDQFCFIDNE